MADLEMRQPDGTWKKIGKTRATDSIVRDLQLFGKVKRRVRVCNCPFCFKETWLDPVRNGMAISICRHCFAAFANDKVVSRLEYPPCSD